LTCAFVVYLQFGMKKTFEQRLLAWTLLISLIYPIAVNFAHSFTHHNLNHITSIEKIDNIEGASCAVLHYIHNYNVPLDDKTFELRTPDQDICHIKFIPFGFKTTDIISKNLRAPPIC